MNRIRILIVDDHNLVRAGIKNMLSKIKTFEVIGEAENGREGIELTKKLRPDIVVMDISMPKLSGIETCKIISQKYPDSKVLILTMHDNEEYVLQVFEAGAKGYILKNAQTKDFVDSIKTIAKGENYLTSNVSAVLLSGYQDKVKETLKDNFTNKQTLELTNREKEIVQLIADGLSNKEVADKLFISIRTVETHRKNLMGKLHLRNTAEIIKYAINAGIVSY